MNLFTIGAILRMDTSDFEKSLKKANGEGKGLGEALGNTFNKIGKLAKTVVSADLIRQVATAFFDLANSTAAAGDKIDKQSQILGLSRQAYQEWDYILSQNGASIDSMAVSMKTLNSAIVDGSDDSKSALLSLGLSYKTLSLMTPEEQFEAVVGAFQKMPAGANKSALAVKLFGRNGMELLPMLNQTAESTEELRQQAHELGLIMSDEAVDASVEYGDAMDTLKATLTAFKHAVGAQILPTLTRGITSVTNYAGKLRKAYDKEGFSGVWKTLVEDFKNIQWPTWDQVRDFVIEKWNGIKEGVEGLAKVVFGENVDGSVKWPTWDEVGDAITLAWNGIISGVGGLAKLVFGENVDGTIKWPTWEDIGKLVETAWKGIVDGVSGLGTTVGKVLFGTNVDGTIKWPTWEDIGKAITDAWNTIKANVEGLAGLVFGKNNDGTVNWPTLESMKAAAGRLWSDLTTWMADLGGLIFGKNETGTVNWPTLGSLKALAGTLWSDLKTWVADLGGLVFGKKEDGSVAWPEWKDVEAAAGAAWEAIKTEVSNLGGLIFGKNEAGDINWPDWSNIVAKAKGYWKLLVETVSNFGTTVAALVFGKKEDGSVDWPTWDTVKAKAEEIWGVIVTEAGKLTGLVFGDSKDAGSVFDAIKSSWDTLYETITGKAIAIGTYFFGEENGETVAKWIHEVGDALKVIGGAILAYKLTTTLTTVFGTIKDLLSFNIPGNSTALIISGIAAALTLIIENWDTIEPVLVQIGDFINEYVIKPIQNATQWVRDGIQAIGEFFGLDIFGDKKKRSGEAIYQQMKDSGLSYEEYVTKNYGTGENAKRAASLAATAQEWEKAGTMNDETYENLYQALAKAQEEAGIATEKIMEVDSAVAGIPSDVTTTIHVVTDTSGYTTFNGNPDPMGVFSHAKGAWDVPYDNYGAILHRNEMVLTASQARQYREGSNVNFGNMIPSIISAIREGMAGAQVNAYMDGRKVTKEVSQNIANDYKSMRFAT